MSGTTYVIGHRNPDTDSIAAAIAYAALKKRLGDDDVVAAMAGEPNPQTAWILRRLGIEPPLYLADIHPKVRDTLNRRPVTIDADASVYDAIALFHRSGVRILPVLDPSGRPCGVLSLLRLSETYLLAGRDEPRAIVTSLPALAATLSGRWLCGGDGGPEELQLFIGAMQAASFSRRIAPVAAEQLLVITGNRRSIQSAAIDRGVRVLIVTGDELPDAELVDRARSAGVNLLVTPHDTATAAWLARLSTPAGTLASADYATIGVAEPLSHLRQKLLNPRDPAILVIEEDGTLAGVATKSSLLAPLPYRLILVDHNETGQAVPGADAVEIIEVIDHHKLGNRPTSLPIAFTAAPVGSTCTLIAGRYREHGLDPEKKIAGLLLAGILSDTVLLKSPTTTPRDVETALVLAALSGLDLEGFGREIFAATGSLSSYPSAERIVAADFKIFDHPAGRFGVGQVEVVGFDEFYTRKDELLAVLGRRKSAESLFIAGLMVTDISTESTLFLVEGQSRIAHVMEYPQLEPHLYELKGVMSRKKQMVPHLLNILSRL